MKLIKSQANIEGNLLKIHRISAPIEINIGRNRKKIKDGYGDSKS